MIVLVVYAGLILLTGWRLTATPTGFIPQQDQGFLIGVVQLPPGASLERTDAVVRQAAAIVQDTPGVQGVSAFAGLDGASFSAMSNGGVFFVKLDDWSKRGKELKEDFVVDFHKEGLGRAHHMKFTARAQKAELR